MKKSIEKIFKFILPLTDWVRDNQTMKSHALHTGDLSITYKGICHPDYLNPDDADMAYDAEIIQVVDMYNNDITGVVCFSSLFEGAHMEILDAAKSDCEYQFTEDRLAKWEAEEQRKFEEFHDNYFPYHP